MGTYRKEKLKSILLYGLCALILAVALYGVYRMVSTVSWNARTKNYKQAVAASIEYAEQKNSMRITVDGGEPVKIRFDRAGDIHTYLVVKPTVLPASSSSPGDRHAVIDCGDGSLLEVWDAGERQMQLSYQPVQGRAFRCTLQYHTAYDGWDAFLRVVSGEYQPG